MKIVLAALAACWLLFFAATARGQSPSPTPPPLLSDGSPTASIIFPDGKSLPVRSQGGRFPLVVGYAGQTFTITCRIPPAILNKLVLEALDGGVLSPPTVNADGTTTLQYQFGTQPGLYRILVELGSYSATLQFWVPGPGDNPPVLTP